MTQTTIQNSLEELHQRLTTARRPEDVFGNLGPVPEEALRQAFLRLVQIAHPDHSADPDLAKRTFGLLMQWREAARRAIAGEKNVGRKVVVGGRVYEVRGAGVPGDYATTYICEGIDGLVMKVVGRACDNGLGEREGLVLRGLGGISGARYFPRLVDTFWADDGKLRRHAVIYEVGGAQTSLGVCCIIIIHGMDPRDAGWMFNRLLEALYHTHRQGLIHGAVVPAHLFYDIANHGLKLTEWGYSVEVGNPLWAISAAHESWYPPEVFAKAGATPAVDIFMAAKCLAYTLGLEVGKDGEVYRRDTDATKLGAVPEEMVRFIRGCLLPAKRRPTDAGALREEFGELLRGLYGKPVFRRFVMG